MRNKQEEYLLFKSILVCVRVEITCSVELSMKKAIQNNNIHDAFQKHRDEISV